jgi:hypothetical protein
MLLNCMKALSVSAALRSVMDLYDAVDPTTMVAKIIPLWRSIHYPQLLLPIWGGLKKKDSYSYKPTESVH